MKEWKRISWLGIVGSILNIIFALAIIVLSITILYGCLVDKFYIYLNIFDLLDNIDNMISVSISTVFILFSIVSIVKNGKLLGGNLKKKVSAIVFAFLTLSILGAIFLILSKVVIKVEKVKIKIVEKKVDYNELIIALLKYKSLLDADVITEDEYKIIKSKIFN